MVFVDVSIEFSCTFSLNEMMNTLFLTSILLSGERDSCLYCALGHQSRSQLLHVLLLPILLVELAIYAVAREC